MNAILVGTRLVDRTGKNNMKPGLFLLFLLLISSLNKKLLSHNHYDFKLVYEWKQIEYKFRSEEERSEAIANGTFNVGKVQPIDAQYVYDNITGAERIFITTPRFDGGFPATLGIITNETRDGNPVIDPYPSWSWQINPEKCNYYRIVSVFRIWADECNRLWVIDDGIVGMDFVCPPQLLTFDLETDKLLNKYEIPFKQYQNKSWYVTPIADIESKDNQCENTWIYIADSETSSLLVYNLKQNTSWRIQDESFRADLNYRNYTVAGDSFQVLDSILTVALTPASDGPLRKLRYHAMSNIIESWVYTKDLKNSTNFEVPFGSPELFHTYKYARNQQSAVEAADRYGNLYFSLLIDIKFIKWDQKTIYKSKNFQVISDDPNMQFPSGVKISPYKGGPKEVLWVFSTALQRYIAGNLLGNRTNFRLFAAIL